MRGTIINMDLFDLTFDPRHLIQIVSFNSKTEKGCGTKPILNKYLVKTSVMPLATKLLLFY